MDLNSNDPPLDPDEQKHEMLRITFIIVGPNGLRWRIASRQDSRAYAAWRLAKWYGGADSKWPTVALDGIRKEPPSVREYIHHLARQFALLFFGNVSRGAVWDMKPLI